MIRSITMLVLAVVLMPACDTASAESDAPKLPPPATWELLEPVGSVTFTHNVAASDALAEMKELPSVADERASERAFGSKRAEHCHRYDADMLYPQLNDSNASNCGDGALRYQASHRHLIVCWSGDADEWRLELDVVEPIEKCPMVCAQQSSAIDAVTELCN